MISKLKCLNLYLICIGAINYYILLKNGKNLLFEMVEAQVTILYNFNIPFEIIKIRINNILDIKLPKQYIN